MRCRRLTITQWRLDYKTVVTCKIKHLQKCFRAIDFSRLWHGHKNVVKMFYFARNHLLSSTCAQNAKTFAKNALVFYFTSNQRKTFAEHLQKCFANVLRWLHVK